MKAREYELVNKYFDLIEHGYLKNEPITDAPEVYHLFSFLTIVGALLKRNAYLPFSYKRIFPNLWTVLVAKSSTFRKSSALFFALKLANEVDENIRLPEEFSLEGLYELLSENPEGIFPIDEFSHFFKQFHRTYMSGGIEFFLKLYENDAQSKRLLKGGSFQIKEPCVSILSATTLEGISSSLKEREIKTGLMPRFNFVVVLKKEREIDFPDILCYKRFKDFAKELKERVECFSERTEFKITEEAIKVFENFLSSKRNKMRNSEFAPFLVRISNSILKMSIIFAFLRGQEEIDKQDMETSCECGEILIKSASIILDQLCWTPFQEKRKKVLDAIMDISEEEGRRWISRTELIRYTRLSSRELNLVVNTLVEEDTIEFKREQGVNDKKPVIYYKIKEEDF